MIEAIRLTKAYEDGQPALSDVNLAIGAGELVFVTGPSGAGKTTLLKLLLGAERPSQGLLTVLGVNINTAADGNIRRLRRNIGAVFQDFRLIRGETALANVMLGLRVVGIPSSQARRLAEEALLAVGLRDKATSRVETLSWGEQQRVAIARALSRRPRLILADEPTGNLDRASADRVMDLLACALADGAAVLVATHDLAQVGRLSGRVLELSGGRLVADSAVGVMS